MFDPTAEAVFADGPVSAPNNPSKALIRKLFRQYETVMDAFTTNGGTIIQGAANLPSLLNFPALTMAWVLDPDPDLSGIYQKQGASGTGSWVRLLDLPYSVIYAQNAGAGTANAVVATSSLPISTSAYTQLISVPFTAANTGAMTLKINDDERPLVTNTGEPIPSGYVQPKMSALVQIDSDGNYRLFSYGDASAIQAVIEGLLVLATAEANRAEAARDAALSAQPQAFPVSRTALGALPDTTVNAYLTENGFEGYFEQVDATDPANAALAAADTSGGEIKISAGNPNLAYLRTRKYGDLFKVSEFGGNLQLAMQVASLRHGKATVEINELGTMVLPAGFRAPANVELIGKGRDRQTLKFGAIGAAQLYQDVSLGIANTGLVLGGGGMTQIATSWVAIAAAGDLRLRFTAPHGLKPGDVVNFWNPADYSYGIWDAVNAKWTGYRPAYRAGQIVGVVAVEGNDVWFDQPIIVPFARAGQNNCNLYKMDVAKGRFGGFSVDITDCTVNQTNPLLIFRASGAQVEDIELIGGTYALFQFRQCHHMRPRRLKSETLVRDTFANGVPPTSSGSDYACLVEGTDVIVRESTFVGNWAGTDIGGYGFEGDSIAIGCGYEDCVITAKHYNVAAGHHGHSYRSGYHRCKITNGAMLAGEASHVTECEIEVTPYAVAKGMLAALNAVELRGGTCDLSGTRIVSPANAGGGSMCAINLNFGGNGDAYLTKPLHFVGKNVSLIAPNETRPIGIQANNQTYPVSVDIALTELQISGAAFFVMAASAVAGVPVSPCFKLDCPPPPVNVPFANVSPNYTVKAGGMKFPPQVVDIPHALAGGATVTSASIAVPNPYPSSYPLSVAYSCPTDSGGGVVVNNYPTYPTGAALKTTINKPGGTFAASGTLTVRASVS